MALITEDGTGLEDADSYVTLAIADEYWADHGNTTWAAASNAAKEEAIRRATTYLDISYNWVGRRKSQSQGLDWPQYGAIDKDGYLILSTAIPKRLKEATIRLAVEALAGDLLEVLTPGNVKKTRRKVGDIETETEYADGGSPGYRSFDFVTRMLSGLYQSKASNSGFSVHRRERA